MGERGAGGMLHISQQLPRSTRCLKAALDKCMLEAKDGRLLDVGSAQGCIARGWVSRGLGATYSHYLLPACKEVARARGLALAPPRETASRVQDCLLQASDATGFGIAFTDVCPPGPYDLATFDTSEYEAPYALEMISHIAVALAPSGFLVTVIDSTISRDAWWEQLKIWFGQVRELDLGLPESKELRLFLARGPKIEKPPLIDYWPWQVSFGGKVYGLCGAPGVFSPRALDDGTAHMLNIIQETLQNQGQARFLDLGCGTGVVSLMANGALGALVTAVDTNARALRLTIANLEANGAHGVQVLPSDGFDDISNLPRFDVIACNPPYHADFGVAKRLIEGAFRQLEDGGRLYIVVKRFDWYARKLESLFGGYERHFRDDYTIFMSERRINASHAAGDGDKGQRLSKAGKKKHMKRLARTKQRKRIAARRR